jgi:hypothetical protein
VRLPGLAFFAIMPDGTTTTRPNSNVCQVKQAVTRHG